MYTKIVHMRKYKSKSFLDKKQNIEKYNSEKWQQNHHTQERGIKKFNYLPAITLDIGKLNCSHTKIQEKHKFLIPYRSFFALNDALQLLNKDLEGTQNDST